MRGTSTSAPSGSSGIHHEAALQGRTPALAGWSAVALRHAWSPGLPALFAGKAGGDVTIAEVRQAFGGIDIGPGATGAAWGDGVLVADNVDGGGARVLTLEFEVKKRLLRAADWIVIVVYLLGMAGIGVFCYMREKRATTADYFVGGRRIPFWAAGLSLYATGTSAVSYIAIPAKSFATVQA